MRVTAATSSPAAKANNPAAPAAATREMTRARSELSQVARIPVEDVVVARTPQNGLANETISSYDETPVKYPSTSAATLAVTDRDAGDTLTAAPELTAIDTARDYDTAKPDDGLVASSAVAGLADNGTSPNPVTNANEAPTDLTVTGGTVQENAAAGTVVATLGATDADAGSSFTYTLAADPSGKFEVVGDEIRVKAGASLDYESATSHQLSVTVTDAGGLSHTETLNIGVTNAERSPDRPHGDRRHGAGECGGRHGGGDAGCHGRGCGLELHLYAGRRSLRQVRGGGR